MDLKVALSGGFFVPKLEFSEPRLKFSPARHRFIRRPQRYPCRSPQPYSHTTTANIPHPSTLMYEAGPIRRKSVDIGGLALALAGGHGCGSGWGGWDEDDISEAMCVPLIPPTSLLRPTETGYIDSRYAEFLSDMYTQTQSTVNYHLATW
jgi:hypothetical protein